MGCKNAFTQRSRHLCLLHVLYFTEYNNPSLNPVSLVNMVMNVGIAVEFSSHLVQAYSLAADDFPDRLERARYAAPDFSDGEDSDRADRIIVVL